MVKAFCGLIFGIFLGYVIQVPTNEKICAVIMLAAIDSISGGAVAKFNSNFSDRALIIDFFTNIIFALVLILLGNFFEAELYYIALPIFGLRIFKNISSLKEIPYLKIF
jgi:small basic protein